MKVKVPKPKLHLIISLAKQCLDNKSAIAIVKRQFDFIRPLALHKN